MSSLSNGSSPARPHCVFTYGTLKTGQRYHHQMFAKGEDGARLVGPARTLVKYPLVVTTPFLIPFLLDREGLGHHVAGEVYQVDDATLTHLDAFEMAPECYQRMRIRVSVISTGHNSPSREMECWAYLIPNSPKYKKSLLDLPMFESFQHEAPKRCYNPEVDGKLVDFITE